MDSDGDWVDVPAKHKRKQKQTSSATASDHKESHGQARHCRQIMIVLMGLPGSGKSTWSNNLVNYEPSVFERVSQDELCNRKKCESRARKILAQGRCPIIDRCNFDSQQRSHFLNIASGIPVYGVVFSLGVHDCIMRCKQRGNNHPTLSSSKAPGVIKDMNRQWQQPNENEGFANIQFLDNDSHCIEAMRWFRDYAHNGGGDP